MAQSNNGTRDSSTATTSPSPPGKAMHLRRASVCRGSAVVRLPELGGMQYRPQQRRCHGQPKEVHGADQRAGSGARGAWRNKQLPPAHLLNAARPLCVVRRRPGTLSPKTKKRECTKKRVLCKPSDAAAIRVCLDAERWSNADPSSRRGRPADDRRAASSGLAVGAPFLTMPTTSCRAARAADRALGIEPSVPASRRGRRSACNANKNKKTKKVCTSIFPALAHTSSHKHGVHASGITERTEKQLFGLCF